MVYSRLDFSGGGPVIPIEEHLGPPVEISHEEFLALKAKHGENAEDQIIEISEEEFNELAQKHGGNLAETVDIPLSPREVNWSDLQKEGDGWIPLPADNQEILHSGAEQVNWQSVPLGETPTQENNKVRLPDSQTEWFPVVTDHKNTLPPINTNWQPVLADDTAVIQHVPVVQNDKTFTDLFTGELTNNGQDGVQQIPFVEPKADTGIQSIDTCVSSRSFFTFKDKVIYKGNECWVIHHFKDIMFPYDQCS